MKVKNYYLNPKVSVDMLESARFIEKKYNHDLHTSKMHYYKNLYDDIKLHIEISVHNDHIGSNMINVIDSKSKGLYHDFYDEEISYPYLRQVVKQYTRTMNELVRKRIFNVEEK